MLLEHKARGGWQQMVVAGEAFYGPHGPYDLGFYLKINGASFLHFQVRIYA